MVILKKNVHLLVNVVIYWCGLVEIYHVSTSIFRIYHYVLFHYHFHGSFYEFQKFF